VGDLRARGARRFALQEYREQGSEDRRLEAFPVSAELEREVEHRWPRFTLRRSGSG
jgi:hypothetical protein